MDSIKSFFFAMSVASRIGLALGAAIVALLTGLLLLWVLSPSEQLLFGNLREADAAEIVQSLNEWKVPHTIVDGGTGISVPEGSVHQTRMRLVSAGIPRGGHVGFELFDDSDFGITEFAQRVNYQRALQGELERTIATIPGVQNARVHLTIRRPGLLVGKSEGSKASVALTLTPGASPERQQVDGIRSLVAAAVEGLEQDAVSVLDSNGALLVGTRSGSRLAYSGLGEEESRLELEITARLEGLLSGFFSKEEFQVSVDATLNFDTVNEIKERPIASIGEVVVRRRRDSSPGDDVGNSEQVEFAHGMSREEISRAPGRIERLSVAVVLPTRLDELRVERVRSLVSAAAGIDADRGDRLEVLRFGRDGAPHVSPPVVGAVQVTAERLTEVMGEPPGRAALMSGVPWLRWILIAVAGLLVGAIITVAAQRRPRALRNEERDAVLTRMRGWLAEGSLKS